MHAQREKRRWSSSAVMKTISAGSFMILTSVLYAGEWTYDGPVKIIESGKFIEGNQITEEEHRRRLQQHQVHQSPDPGEPLGETKLPLMRTERHTEYRVISDDQRLADEIAKLRKQQRISRIQDKNDRFLSDLKHKRERDNDQYARKKEQRARENDRYERDRKLDEVSKGIDKLNRELYY